MAMPWFRMSEGQTTAAIAAAERFAAMESALQALIEAGPGGGGNIVRQQTVTLTDAETKALPIQEIDILPASGAGLAYVPIVATTVLTVVSSYTGVQAFSGLTLIAGGPDVSTLLTNFMGASPGTLVGGLVGNAFVAGTDTYFGYTESGRYRVNAKLSIFAYNNDGIGGGQVAFGGGNVGNSLRVSVAYLVLDTASGLFLPPD